jgi:hypothetical protein
VMNDRRSSGLPDADEQLVFIRAREGIVLIENSS